jgi:hypothetical protein
LWWGRWGRVTSEFGQCEELKRQGGITGKKTAQTCVRFFSAWIFFEGNLLIQSGFDLGKKFL